MGPDSHLPGSPSSALELRRLGFRALELAVTCFLETTEGLGCEWDTLGSVPEAPGHYLFTVEDGDRLHVAYAGLTEHLWMVTMGRLPRSGGARGGQRYGRPRHSGATRRRINALVAEQLKLGRGVAHWVRPMRDASLDSVQLKARLRSLEEDLIVQWDLRRVGWNKG